MTGTLDAAQLLATFAKLGIDAEAIVAANFDFIGGSIDDGYNAAGGLTGARGYYPLTNADGQTVYVPCWKRIQLLSVGGGDPAVLESILGVQVQAATDKATAAAGSATAAAASATSAGTAATSAGVSATAATTAASSITAAASTASSKAAEASASATGAAASATTAQNAATTATSKASEASASATNAATSATGAAGLATTATTKASDASAAAATATSKAAEAASSATTATNKAGEAATSAASIVGAVPIAQAAAMTATDAATSASGSATTATGAANTATTKAATALTSATNAATSETNAGTSAANAATSAIGAAASATTASTAASTATSKASDAAASAATAGTAATTATNKASDASSSASSAQTYRDQAQTYAGQAQAATGGALLIGNDLNDLHSPPTARQNLGLGTLATQSGTFSGTSSGYNSGDQTIVLTGDLTGSGTGSFPTTLAARSVKFGNLVAAVGAVLLGATAAGDYGPLSPSDARAVLGVGSAALLNAGTASGNVFVLDSGGKVPVGLLPEAVTGAMKFRGFWNAATNVVTYQGANAGALPAAAAANLGYYYIVQTAGTTSVNGVTDWQVGDWAVSDGGAFDKIDSSDQVNSVAGLQGTITAPNLRVALGLVVGTNVQAYSAQLDALALLTGATYGRALITQVDAPTTRTYLGLGSIAVMPEASAAEYRAATASRALSAAKAWAAAQYVALVDAATIAVDLSTFLNATVTLAGNRTLGAPSNGKPGQSGVIEIKQDATGSRTLAYASAWSLGSSVPVLSTTAGTRDLLYYQVLSDGKVDAYLSKAR